jgi:hypothetical protein
MEKPRGFVNVSSCGECNKGLCEYNFPIYCTNPDGGVRNTASCGSLATPSDMNNNGGPSAGAVVGIIFAVLIIGALIAVGVVGYFRIQRGDSFWFWQKSSTYTNLGGPM